MYPIEVVEHDGSRVRIHYVGYDESSDEWRDSSDIIQPRTPLTMATESNSIQPIQQYSLYNELRIKIKQALVCGRKQSPSVVINMGFDLLLFNGGLEAAGKAKRVVCGNQHYKLASYDDLDKLLGPNWHYRGINENCDYAFAILDSIEYYIHRRKQITEYYPSKESAPVLCKLDTGYSLRFNFVRGYGNSATFGKDKDIFG